MEAKLNCLTCLQPTATAVPAENRPWEAINRSTIHHFNTQVQTGEDDEEEENNDDNEEDKDDDEDPDEGG